MCCYFKIYSLKASISLGLLSIPRDTLPNSLWVFLFLIFKCIYWSIVDLQCCLSFRYSKMIQLYMYIYMQYAVAQSCPTLCNLMDCSPPGFSVRGISQARVLEWVAIFSSREFLWPRDQTHISCISCIGRRILYHWATWEAIYIHMYIGTCIYLLFQILSLYRVLKILFSVLHSRPYWLSILYIVVWLC